MDLAQCQSCAVTGIVSRQRNVGIPAQRSGEEIRANIANLQAVVGEEQSCRDTIERQRFAKEDIVHSVRAIDLDLQPCVLAPTELVHTVSDDIRRTPELVRNNSFRGLRIDPENYLCRIQRTADVRDSHLVFFEIIRETAGTGAFVPRDLNIFVSDRAVGEMNPGVGAVHPCSAKPGASKSNCAVAVPTLGIAICAANCHPDCRRTLPLPFPQKLVYLRRNERAHCLWRYGALKV